jgi:c-di-GMP phosphodiesterase
MSSKPWWSRWWGQATPAAAPARAAPPLVPAAAADARLPPGALRRPLVGRDGRVAAFEWLLPGLASRPQADRVALLAALAASGRPGLVSWPRALVAEPALQAALPAGLWLALDALPTPELATALRQRGVRVGAPAALPVAEPRLDFVVATAEGAGLETLSLAEQRWRERQPQLQCVALGMTSLDEAEQLLARGFQLIGGRLARGRAPAAGRPLGAAAHRICALLSQLAQDADTAAVAEAVRADVALGYRLLRYANSPSIGLRRPAETVEQAIQVLGRREITRWLQTLLLAAAAARPAQRALQEHTLVRARLLERLAERRGEADAGALFTLGLMSTLDQLLQLPLATAVAPLRLREEALQALLQRRGPWAPQLALLDALDDPDESQAWAAAAALGQAEVLAEEAEAAWAWVAALDVGG